MEAKIELLKADITKMETDAIVNAANSSLMGGGGVDGAIHKAGGPTILEECKKIVARQGDCKAGDAVITGGGRLPASYVIHTVGPRWKGGEKNEAALLASCYRKSLDLAQQHQIKDIAFPNISTGVYGYPKQQAARIAVKTVQEWLEKNSGIEKVIFVCFDDENYALYEKLLSEKEVG